MEHKQLDHPSCFANANAYFMHCVLNKNGFHVDLSDLNALQRLKSVCDPKIFLNSIQRLGQRPDDGNLKVMIRGVINRAGIIEHPTPVPAGPNPSASAPAPHGQPSTKPPQRAGAHRDYRTGQQGGQTTNSNGPQAPAASLDSSFTHPGKSPRNVGGESYPITDASNRVVTHAVVRGEDGPATLAAFANPRRLNQHRAFGGRAAVQLEADLTRLNEKKETTYNTVALDFASGENRNYDWSNKLRIQLTRGELPEVLAVFLGILPSCKFSSHGEGKDKGFELAAARTYEKATGNETGRPNFKLKGFAKGRAHAIQVTLEDAFLFTSILTRQLLCDHPGYGVQDLYAMLRAVYGRLGHDMQDKWYQPVR